MSKGKNGFLSTQRHAAQAHGKTNPRKPKVPITGGAGPVKKP